MSATLFRCPECSGPVQIVCTNCDGEDSRIADIERANAELAAALEAILTIKDDHMRGVEVRLPFSVESQARAALAKHRATV